MQTDRMLTEIERQEKYLDRLPKDFDFPLFNSRQAVESQRRNGYRNTAAAAREIVDNAIEAGAKNIHVLLEQGHAEKKGYSETVTAVAFIDDGPGMVPKMARYALSWGGGTHFDDPAFIGKFGFGLPNSSINQTRRVEVYTKIADSPKVMVGVLDIDDFVVHGMQSVPEPVEGKLPEFVQKYLAAQCIKFEHGTVVLWVKPDRLSYKTAARLKEHLVDDFGVTYRYLLGNMSLTVAGVKVDKVDPLFLDPTARFFVPESENGAKQITDRSIPVKYIEDPSTGIPRLVKMEKGEEVDPTDKTVLTWGAIGVRISRFPVGFLEFKGKRVETDARRRAEIRKTRAGMSFVRAGREIETVVTFPKSAKDQSNGLGTWPLLQGYAYHLGIEVKFSPQLDDVFGITNDKQSVRPAEDFWRLLAKEEVDKVVREEYRWQVKERARIKKAALRTERSDEPTPAEKAAMTADAVQGKVVKVPEFEKPKIREKRDAEVTRQVATTARAKAEVEAALEQEAKRRSYLTDYFDDPAAAFFVPEWTPAGQVLVKINRAHQFFDTLYLEAMEANPKVKHAIDVLLFTLARAEVTSENELTREWYREQRENNWSPFLRTSLLTLAQELADDHEEEEQPEDTEATA